MPSYPARALVLKKTKLGETDAILTLLADTGSQLRGVAKGVRKPGSRFGGRLEPFCVSDLLLHEGRNLDIITEASLVNAHEVLVTSLERGAAGAVVLELLDRLSIHGEPDSRNFGLAQATLGVMECCPESMLPAVVAGFVAKALAIHGYRPELDACLACGGALGETCVFAVDEGGAVCSSCAGEAHVGVQTPGATVAWLRFLITSTMAQIAEADMPVAAALDCLVLTRGYAGFHLDTRLKAFDYFMRMATTGE